MDKDTLDDDKEAFALAYEAEKEQRKISLDDLKFARLGEQWSDRDKAAREAEGRPCLTINKLPSFIRQVVNDGRQNRPRINVKPTGGGASKETALILDGLIRNIETVSSADIAYDTALDFSATMGYGYITIDVDYSADDSFDQDIFIRRVSNPFSVFGDPHSDCATSESWNSAFVVTSLPKSEFKKRYKDAKAGEIGLEGLDDVTKMWFEEDTVRYAERWYREKVATELIKLSDDTVLYAPEYEKIRDLMDAQGISIVGTRPSWTYKVSQRIITGVDVLETNQWLGKYIPIIPVYGEEINIEGKRHFRSLVRDAKDPQRMFNYWRTASTELVALAPKAPYIGPTGAFVTDADKWATANTVSHPYLEFDGPQAPQRQPFSGVPAGALQEALNASDDMKAIMGIYDASLGARSNETSGKAIMARQREGDVGTYHFIDNLSRAISHTGKCILDLIPKVYTVPRVIRCVKFDGDTYDVPINQPVIPGQPAEPGAPTEQFQLSPQEIRGVTKVFDLTTGKYDAVVTTGPSFTTKREESAMQIMEFIRVFPQSAPLIGDILAKNLDWAGSDEIAARLKAMLPPQARGQVDPMVQQLQMQLQQQDQMAKQAVSTLQQQIAEFQKQLEMEQAKVQAAQNDRAIDVQKLEVDMFNAQTNRMKVENEQNKIQADTIKEINTANQQEIQKQTMEAEEQPEVKTISITAPSGNTYTGVVVDGKIQINGPTGQFQGTMESQS